MGIEIERKFLVKGEAWKQASDEGLNCRQGYLASNPQTTIRVRLIGDQAFLTLKGPTTGITRSEFEYEIPRSDGTEILDLCGNKVVEKRRYLVQNNGLTWEIDLFSGANAGLVIAEIELSSEDQLIDLPEWVGKEVSFDRRYRNGALARHTFSDKTNGYWE